MKSNVERMTEDLKKVLFSNVYSYETDGAEENNAEADGGTENKRY